MVSGHFNLERGNYFTQYGRMYWVLLGPSSYSSTTVVASFPRWNLTAAGSPHPLSLAVFLRGIFAIDVHNDCGEQCRHSKSRVHLELLLLMEVLGSVDSGCFGPTMLRCICMSQQRSQQYQVPSAHGNQLENTPNGLTFPVTLFSFS